MNVVDFSKLFQIAEIVYITLDIPHFYANLEVFETYGVGIISARSSSCKVNDELTSDFNTNMQYTQAANVYVIMNIK
jgi:hypothetical protein